MNEAQIQETVIRLSSLKSELTSRVDAFQETLRGYVTSRQFLIHDRFEVWTEWGQKKNYDRSNIEEFPLIHRMVEDEEPYEFYRYEEFDWLFFLEVFSDPGDAQAAEQRERYCVTSDDVKELLIKHNLGTFRMDW